MATKYRTDSYPYRVYTALISQTGTSAPTATVLQNTLGGTLVWTRNSIGIYLATLVSAFTVNKTFILPVGDSPDSSVVLGSPLSSLPDYFIYRIDADTIGLDTSLNDGTPSDDLLGRNSIEIRVYN